MDLAASPTFQTCSNHPDVAAGLVACARCGQMFCADCVVEIDGKPYDAACKEEQIRDLQSGVVALPISSASARFVGAIVDGLVSYVIAFGGMFLGLSKWGQWSVAGLLIPVIGVLLYEGLMTQYCDGQTLGKKAAKTRIVRADGSPITPGQAWARAGARALMAATYVLGFVDALMVYSQDRRTLHDRIARTKVIDARR